MRRYGLILLAALLCAGKLHALSVDDEKRSQDDSSVQQQSQSRKNQAPEKSGKKAAAPVSTFKPTERISADSAVSFPVDI
ncbi:MAG: hypothetical protein OEU63_06635 [Gammaproteobacteria bacterium]|nr:hypothetical protein [Gammaproteobacteria bacterium]MDH3971836.1 hypothetical protein [Gammaproteobacteria bacterium]